MTRVHNSGIESCTFFFSCELLLINHCKLLLHLMYTSLFNARELFAVLFGD